MSTRFVRDVLEADIRPSSAKLVAIVLAEHADDDGICWPGYRLMAREASLTQMTVSRAVKRLRDLGIAVVEKGRHHGTSTYHLSTNKLLELGGTSSNIDDSPAPTSAAASSNIGSVSALTLVERNGHTEPSRRTARKKPSVVASTHDDGHAGFLEKRYMARNPDVEEVDACSDCGDLVEYFTPDGDAFCERHGPGPDSLLVSAGYSS